MIQFVRCLTLGVLGMSVGCSPASQTNSELEPAPYGIEKRPQPKDFANESVAPKRVGEFELLSIEDAEDSKPQAPRRYAHYQKPGSMETPLVVGIFVHESAVAAQKALASQYSVTPNDTEKLKKSDPAIQAQLGTDPSYYRHPSSGEGAEFYFTRDRVGFLVQAFQGEAELDEFMASFPY